MTAPGTAALSGEEGLRRLVDQLSDQLSQAAGGCSDFTVKVDTDDASVKRLQKLINSTLDTASHSLAGLQARNEELHEAHAQVRATLEHAADGIITMDHRGVVQSFNAAAQEMFGYGGEEVVGANIGTLMPSPHSEELDGYLEQYLATGARRILGGRREVVGRRKDGTTFPMEIHASELHLGDRRLFIGVVRDVSERRRLESENREQKEQLERALEKLKKTHTQLLQSQKLEAIGQLAAGIAHEINTPTQFVGDNTRFIRDAFRDLRTVLDPCRQLLDVDSERSVKPDVVERIGTAIREADLEYLLEEVPKAIEQTLEGVERVASIVRSMKEFSHPGIEEKTAVDLNRAIESTITVARNEWKYVAEMVTDFDPSLPPVSCLAGDINQVVLNLIINAAHAIADAVGDGGAGKGAITVSTRHAGECVEIRVTDTGTGIPQEIRRRVFDPFFTTKPVGKGTGQGLAIAHAVIVDKHGGTITCESEPGSGTTFAIRLPIHTSTVEVAGDVT